MKKLQVMIDDELMTKAKIYTAQHGITLKDLVSELLTLKFESKDVSIKESLNHSIIESPATEAILKDISIKESFDASIIPSNNITPSYTNDFITYFENPTNETEFDFDAYESDPFAVPHPMDERYFYIIRKTHTLGMVTEEDGPTTTNGAVWWEVPVGCYRNFDKDKVLIPFRYTTPEGKVVEPTESQLEQLMHKYGKQGVTVEV